MSCLSKYDVAPRRMERKCLVVPRNPQSPPRVRRMLAARALARPAHRARLAAGLLRSRSGRASAMAAQKRPRTTAGAQADADDPIEGASDVGFRYEVCRTASFDTRGEAFRVDSRTDEHGVHLERVPRASFVPSLTRDARDATKGFAGRVAVVGGCAEYAGAPFFAAISALRTGCDVAHVFCTESAAPVIRSFSPEIIAHPYVFETSQASRGGAETGLMITPATTFTRDGALNGALDALSALSDDERLSFDDGVRKTKRWLKNMDALVIGPGLGRDPIALAFVRDILLFARETNVPTVIDADGLFLVSLDPTIARGNANVVLTPNAAELSRLARAILGENAARKLENVVYDENESNEDGAFANEDDAVIGATKKYSPRERVLRALSDDLRGPAILSKGGVDLGVCAGPVGDLDGEAPVRIGGEEEADRPTIAPTAKRANEHVVAWCAVREGGSPRRCGGQGDVLAGSLATFLAWASAGVSVRRARGLRIPRSHTLSAAEKVSAAAHAARVTRDAARIAFGKKKRATTASDVAEALGEAFEARFPADRASYASSEERATSPKNEKRA